MLNSKLPPLGRWVRSLLLGVGIVLLLTVLPGRSKALFSSSTSAVIVPPQPARLAQAAAPTGDPAVDALAIAAQQWLSLFSQMPGGQANPPVDSAIESFVPQQEWVQVDSSNYDYRMATDIYGNPSLNPPIVVLHETVGSAASALNTFRNHHASDDDQVSYHSLIKRDGTIVHLVPPELRAFGAGNSVFAGANGNETVRLDPVLPPSVNNFAYHTSLESPPDGRGNQRSHSGYTEAQYRSLAWLVAHTLVGDDRITTHQAVDRSGSRRDPRSFNRNAFTSLLQSYRGGDRPPA